MQNIGGIGNVTFLPPMGSSTPPLAFDTGPVNVLIDWAAARATDGALTFDEDGRLAAQGRCADELVESWLSHPYFQQRPPKSTGREMYSHAFAERLRKEAEAAGLRVLGKITPGRNFRQLFRTGARSDGIPTKQLGSHQ